MFCRDVLDVLAQRCHLLVQNDIDILLNKGLFVFVPRQNKKSYNNDTVRVIRLD